MYRIGNWKIGNDNFEIYQAGIDKVGFLGSAVGHSWRIGELVN